MKYFFSSSNELQTLPNIVKSLFQKLIFLGIPTVDVFFQFTPEQIFLKMMEQSGWEKGMCTCFLYDLEGAQTGGAWNKIPETRKKEFLSFVKETRRFFLKKINFFR